MAYAPGIRLRAIELYLELQSVHKVYEKICKEYIPVLGEKGLPKEITIRKWVENNMLPEVIKNMEVEVISRTRSREIEEQVAKKEQHEKALEIVLKKGTDELPEMEFTSAMEASKAIELAINGQRKIAKETINLQFIDDVLSAITTIITDDDMKRKIGLELRKIFQKYSKE